MTNQLLVIFWAFNRKKKQVTITRGHRYTCNLLIYVIQIKILEYSHVYLLIRWAQQLTNRFKSCDINQENIFFSLTGLWKNYKKIPKDDLNVAQRSVKYSNKTNTHSGPDCVVRRSDKKWFIAQMNPRSHNKLIDSILFGFISVYRFIYLFGVLHVDCSEKKC